MTATVETAWIVFAAVAALFAVLPACVYFANTRLYRPPRRTGIDLPPVSLLIPARDEERSIRPAVESALASEGIDLEVVVLDDGSTDATRSIVESIAARDARVRVLDAPPLPDGWCGKQHACWTLAHHARHEVLAFIDADVRLAPTGLARSVEQLVGGRAGLVSGVPLEETGTFFERLLLPLIHFLLLGFLPIWRMRASTGPAYAAGCGQLFVTTKDAYGRAGGHRAIRKSLHDGVTLPAAYRRAGLLTDLFDATDVARCRMYRSAHGVLVGLAKNATEGLAHPARIVPITALLIVGQVAPAAVVLLAFAGLVLLPAMAGWLFLAAWGCGALVRVDAASRFRQSALGAALHPAGVLALVAIQWYALGRQIAGRPSTWKGRSYGSGTAESTAGGRLGLASPGERRP